MLRVFKQFLSSERVTVKQLQIKRGGHTMRGADASLVHFMFDFRHDRQVIMLRMRGKDVARVLGLPDWQTRG
jgi:hypothetical protein